MEKVMELEVDRSRMKPLLTPESSRNKDRWKYRSWSGLVNM